LWLFTNNSYIIWNIILSKIALMTTINYGDNNDDEKADCKTAAPSYQEPLLCHLCGKPELKGSTYSKLTMWNQKRSVIKWWLRHENLRLAFIVQSSMKASYNTLGTNGIDGPAAIKTTQHTSLVSIYANFVCLLNTLYI